MNQKANVVEAVKAYPWHLLHKLGAWGMKRSFPWNQPFRVSVTLTVDGMSLSNKLYLIGARRMKPWASRYPQWSKTYQYSCGREVGGGRCQISGLGHPGPCRLNPAMRGAKLPVALPTR